jgi:MFS family permease
LLLHTTLVAGALVGPPLGGFLLEKLGPRRAFLWTFPPRLFSLVFLYLIPETKDIAVHSSPESSSTAPESSTNGEPTSLKKKLGSGIQHFIQHWEQDIWPIISRTPVFLGMLSLVVNTFATPIAGIILQYVSVKFLWKFSEVRKYLFIAEKSLVNITK